tara:strand:+ start:1001 stop:1378 length:378 start_codon:yes stop_codon:yes gene_type:complete
MGLIYRSDLTRALTITELDNNFRHFTGSHSVTGSLTVTETGSFGFLDTTNTVFSGSTFVQSFLASENSTVTVTHNLNQDFPIVQVYSASRLQVIPTEISSSNANQIVLDFNGFNYSFTGSVVINK